MGISKNGLHGTHTGKVGNLVYYERNGKNIVRTIGQNLKPPTMAQLRCRQQISVTSKVMSKILPFLNLGFKMQTIGKDLSPYNVAMAYNKVNALKGTYPDIVVDFEKVLISDGNLMGADAAEVLQIPEGLRFNWYVDATMTWPDYTDQIMMLAYFPALHKTVYRLFGPERITGTAILEISEPMQTAYMETYISFISADRSQTAKSTYTGSFNVSSV